MTESDAARNGRSRARLLAGGISCAVGLLLAAGQVLYTLVLGGGVDVTPGILGIAFCILGYYLDSRRPATATIFLCVAAILFGMARSQGLV